jgi:hypothetical protein
MSLYENNKLFLVGHKYWFVSHWPPTSEIGMLLITNFLELGMVAARGRKLASRHHAVSERPMLIHAYPAVALRGHFQKGIFVAWQGNSTVCVNQTRLHCINQMGKTQSKALTERHGTCESAVIVHCVAVRQGFCNIRHIRFFLL